MNDFIVLDTQIVIDLLNKKERLEEAIKLLNAIENFNARLGLTIQSVYELIKKDDSDEKLYQINHFLANKLDFIVCDKRIIGSELLDPKKWDTDQESFDYDRYRLLINSIKMSIKEFYVEQVSCLVSSIVGFIFFLKGLNGSISCNYFKAFALASDYPEVLKVRNERIKSIAKASLASDDFYDKNKSKLLFENIITESLNELSGYTLTNLNVKILDKEIRNTLKNRRYLFKDTKEILNVESSEKFVDSFFKHINRNSEDGLMLRGLNFLFNKYIFGRKISINDFIDLSNLDCIDNSLEGNNCYYFTREKFWNEQFADCFAKDIKNIYKCRVIGI